MRTTSRKSSARRDTIWTRVARSPVCQPEKNEAGIDSTRIMTAASSGTATRVAIRASTIRLTPPRSTWARRTPASSAAIGPTTPTSPTSSTGPKTIWFTRGATRPSSVTATTESPSASQSLASIERAMKRRRSATPSGRWGSGR